ncbi:uncharacterized protein LOC134539941 [Bacillus rossius redtenbacheri]|uniref:uncharacterized protein LOC134539941 n=1 Tax=Bacillus rossius redtenbacheri TaxID=93214 RepID=UPI002FDD5566
MSNHIYKEVCNDKRPTIQPANITSLEATRSNMKQQVIAALVALLLCVASTFGTATSRAGARQSPLELPEYGGNEPSTYNGYLECGLREFSGETRTNYCCTIPYYNLFPGVDQTWASANCGQVIEVPDPRIHYCCVLPGDQQPPPAAKTSAVPQRPSYLHPMYSYLEDPFFYNMVANMP